MKPYYLTFMLLFLIVTQLHAQNDANLYDTWKSSNNNATWSFSDRYKDDVDRGSRSYLMEIPITDNCSCNAKITIPFDWKSDNGKINLYYNLNSAYMTVEVISEPGASQSEIDLANKTCKPNAEKSFATFKSELQPSAELPYVINGSTLTIEGLTYTSVLGVYKVKQ